MKKLLLMVAIPLLSYIGQAQVGINNTDPKASLDISASDVTSPSNTDGILIPRIEDFPSTNPTMDQHGMMVYLTTTSGSNSPGFYYWDDNAGPAAWVSVKSNDIDWYISNTNNPPTAITDDLVTQGSVTIGNSISGGSSKLNVYSNDTNPSTLRIDNSGTIGLENRGIVISNNSLSGTSSERFVGVLSSLSSSDGFSQTGFKADFDNMSSGGVYYGFLNDFQALSTNGYQRGFRNYFGGGEIAYGVENIFAGAFTYSGATYGVNNTLQSQGNGTKYGIFNSISGTGTGIKYGTFTTIDQAAGGTHYGIYSDVRKTNSYAGYFIGRTSFGTGTTNRYLMPSVDGSANQVITTDGSGQLSFSTINNEDHDWYEEGTTNSPNAISDNMFTQGNVGIGDITPDAKLDVSYSGDANIGTILDYEVTGGSGGAYGLQVNAIASFNRPIVAAAIELSSTSTAGQAVGLGVTNNTTSSSSQGIIVNVGGSSSGSALGVDMIVSTTSNSDNFGLYTVVSGATRDNFGARLAAVGTGQENYGIYSYAEGATTNWAGYFGDVSAGAGSGNVYVQDNLQVDGTLQVGPIPGSGYRFPIADGTSGQVLTTNGTGNLSFITPAITGVNLDQAYDYGGPGNGRNINADSGAVNIAGADGLRVGGDITVGANIIHDLDLDTSISFTPDRIEIDAGGVNYIDIENTNSEITINEGSNAINFRVESDNENNMLLVHGTNNAIGIGENNPNSPLEIGIETPFDLNVANSGQDGIFIIGNNGSGLNGIGGSISFGGAHSARKNSRRAAISSLQTGTDEDNVGLAFYIHQGPVNTNPMVEGMRLTHQRYLGINNSSPSANLDVIGSMQFEDGNESAGFVLASDASGNATWTDPSTLNTSDDDWVVSGGNVLRNTGNVLVNRANQNYKLSLGGYNIGSQYSFVDITPSNSLLDAMIISTNYDGADGLSVSQNSSYTLATRSAITTFTNRGSMTANLGYYSNVPTNRSVGLYVTNPGSSSNTYGVLYEVNNTTSTGGDRYGLVADIDIDGSGGTYYGIKSDVEGLGNSTKYGVYAKVTAPNSIGYGLYSDVQSTNDYAAYLIGRTSLGLSTSNRYLMPTVDGTSGQVMTTNGSGQVSFTTINNDDHDWYEEGSTNSPNAITDDIYTQGNVAIGKTSASYPLDIEVTGAPSNLIALNIVDNSTGTGDHIGIQQTLSGTHNESIKGLETYITNSGNGLHTGISTSVQNGTGNQVGNRATLNGSLGTNAIFSGSIFNSGSASSSTQTGLDISVQQPSSQISYGVFNTLNASGSNASGIKYGVYNLIDGGAGNHFGVYNDVRGTGNNTKYGTYNLFGIGSTNTGGILYGTYNSFGNSITSTSDKYGNYTLIPSGLSGTHYGTYNDVSSSNGWAGYFIGRNYISERLSIGETDNANASLNVSGNSSSSNSQIVIEETTVNDGARMRFTNSVETTNEWLLFGRADNTNTESRFNINHTSTGNIMQIRGDGRVGINNNNPTYALELPNNATVTVGQARANAWVTYSDSRVKKKQQMIRYGLEDLLKIEPKSYIQYASEFGELGLKLKKDSGTSQIGFIAQDLYEIIPEATFKPKDENIDLWSIDYEKLIPVVVQSIKELNTKVEDLENENQQLKTMLSKYEDLEARLSALEEKPNATVDVANNK